MSRRHPIHPGPTAWALAALTLATVAPVRAHAADVAPLEPGGGPVDCEKYRKEHGGELVVIFDGKSRALSVPRRHTYASVPVRVCITNPDYRFRFGVDGSLTDLPKPQELPVAPSVDENVRTNAVATSTVDVAELVRKAEAAGAGLERALRSVVDSTHFVSTAEARKTVGEIEEHQRSLGKVEAALRAAPTQPTDAQVAARASAAKALADAQRWRAPATALVEHVTALEGNLFAVETAAEKELAITVSRERLRLAIDGGDGPELIREKAEVVGSSKIEIRSLTYVRVNLGVVFTSNADRSYRIDTNDVGARVIQSGDDAQFVPMFVLSHFWCGADMREVQPFDDSRGSCGWTNYLPTFALGLPLNKSPLENLFLGAMWAPVPGLALVGGAHIGRVSRLRTGDGFVLGAAPPSDPSFRIENATERVVRTGFFFGAAVTDAVFVNLLRPLVE